MVLQNQCSKHLPYSSDFYPIANYWKLSLNLTFGWRYSILKTIRITFTYSWGESELFRLHSAKPSGGTLELFLLLSANPSGAGSVNISSACESLRNSGIGLSDAKFGVGLGHGDISILSADNIVAIGHKLSPWSNFSPSRSSFSFLPMK